MPAPARKPSLTPEEYLALDRAAEAKSEFYDGVMYAMAGARRPHNLIAANLARILGNQIVDRPSELYVADMRTRGAASASSMYPDLAVVCGEPRFADDEFDTLLNPNLVIEILSDSTEQWDRNGKFARYREAESLAEYVLIDQKRIFVERFARRGDEWERAEFDRPDAVIRLDSIQCELTLAEVYAKVPFPTPE